ncbi:MAG TPA: phosphoenolpyruvate--protein phosphotransferase [Allosphingosinicella sp.]|nr:phosphoenolpyruvate--protein phosphotransferase [Allosphingosinicella sp.]
MSAIRLGAPMSGWAAALDEVPDPVFAERMMGDGIAIDPLEGLVRAPADAIVASLPETAHAVTLDLANGAQILIHIGIDTVALGGEGFEACVAAGQRVAAGDPLIRFDLDAVARRVRSLITPIVLVNDGFRLTAETVDRRVAAGETLIRIEPAAAAPAAFSLHAGPTVERRIRIPLPNGLHARPAARVATLAKSFAAEVRVAAHDRSADGRSMVALMALGLRRGDEAILSAAGADAEAAVAALAALIESGMDEPEPAAVPAPAKSSAPSGDASVLPGIVASPGLAIGPVAHFRPAAIDLPADGAGVAAEERALAEAMAAVAASLDGADADSGLAAAHRALLEDPALAADARAEIAAGRSAGQAWRTATAAAAEKLRETGDKLLIERVADLEDIERQLLVHLTGVSPGIVDVPAGAILVADALLPSQFLALRGAIAGIATADGGPTSHVAILAAAAGVPMLVAVGRAALAVPDGRQVILDADSGRLESDPDATAIAAAGERVAGSRERRAAQAAAAREDCRMADGVRIEIFANLASPAEAALAVEAGAEGCGLLRTEFLFLDRPSAPSEEEQAQAYAAIAAALGDRPLIVRTLDVGADKPVAYLPRPREENPALGQRGIRLSLARPDLLRTQLRAILGAVPGPQCRIMLPMIVERGELAAVRVLLDEAAAAVGRTDRIPLGVMIETPAAALLAADIAGEADFLSIGTNDLTQYALAADRLNPATAMVADALHPAVLHLIRHAAEGARKHGRWLGVCGGIASDPAAAPILIGLGATELSAAPAAIPALKAAVRALSADACVALAERALACGSAADVRALLEKGV